MVAVAVMAVVARMVAAVAVASRTAVDADHVMIVALVKTVDLVKIALAMIVLVTTVPLVVTVISVTVDLVKIAHAMIVLVTTVPLVVTVISVTVDLVKIVALVQIAHVALVQILVMTHVRPARISVAVPVVTHAVADVPTLVAVAPIRVVDAQVAHVAALLQVATSAQRAVTD
jgi:hypothetical protein